MTFLKSDNAELCEMVIDNKLAKAIAKCQRAKIFMYPYTQALNILQSKDG